MADFQNAGYRLLSFKYTPPLPRKKQAADEDKVDQGVKSQAGDAELPSLSSLLTSLREIEGPDDTETKTEAGVELEEEKNSGGDKKAIPETTSYREFHRFGDLPTELRLKIWDLTFLPRVVELRPTRPNYSQGHDDGRPPQWQSGCSNPAALAVSVEAREAALAHFRIPFPLAVIAAISVPSTGSTQQQQTIAPVPFQPRTTTYAGLLFSGVPSSTENGAKARLLHRTLYVSPEHDTVCLLGQDSDFAKLSHVMRTFREADPLDLGLGRLGLSVRGWGYGGSAVMMKSLGRTLLRELDQLVLFMYGEHLPPATWRAKGSAMMEGEDLQQYRRDGNRCELIPCEGGSAWYAYKVWSGGKGRQFWDEDGNVMRIGRESNEIRIMDLEFRTGW